jgi:ATP-binding cassette subfamily F protein 3
MSILTISGVSQSFGAFDVFQGLSASVPNDGKIGLVGPNGIGKTTLLRVIAGLSQPDTGSIFISKGTRLGYLRQEAVQAFAERDNTVHEEMLTVFAPLREQEARLRQMEEQMAHDHSDDLLDQYSKAQERFEMAGGYEYELRIRQTLAGLGFKEHHWAMPLRHLSGGQMTRALLARLLLESPDLLILDEPTNHLDVGAVEWLEGTLRQWEGALLIVSHDRYFLDNVVNRVWEMSRTHIEVYRGNYSAYVQQRQERWERQQQLFEAERERLDKELEFIRRNIAGQNTDIAKGKLKRLSRELVAIEALGFAGVQGKSWSEISSHLDTRVREMTVSEAAERIRAFRPPSRPPRLSIRLKSSLRGGDEVLRAEGLRVGYPGNFLFESDDILLNRGEVAALIGPNGTGKTTFLKTVLRQHEPLAGVVRLGSNLKIGYFAQAHDGLNLDNAVIDELTRQSNMSAAQGRHYLAQYLFREDDVYKPVRALRGGERGRLALAILASRGANFLLLDEPTNHLDIPSQEVLQEVLELFEGTVLLVSHDRYLVNRLATQVWELREGHLHVFPGSYRELLEARERERQQVREIADAGAATRRAQSQPERTKPSRRQLEAVEQLETRIAKLEAALAQCEHDLQTASEAQDVAEMRRLTELHDATQTELERRVAEWETLAEAVV